jgi:hypothetical protein
MASKLFSFALLAKNGCLVVRDSVSDTDLSNWDARSELFYRGSSALIFGVSAPVDGPVSCSVWMEEPDEPLPYVIFSDEILECDSGRLIIEDPTGNIEMSFGVSSGLVRCTTYADDPEGPEKVQVVVLRQG